MLKQSLLFLFWAATLVLAPGVLGKYIQPTCTPAENQVSLFSDPNFSGTCVTLEIGVYQHHETLPISNDSISSIMMGSDVFATVCQDGNFKGICNTLYTNAEDMAIFTVGTDSISSFNIESRTCLPNVDQVALFDVPAYGGHCILLKQGIYVDSKALGMENDSISSVLTSRLKSNVFVTLCEHSKLNGVCEAFTADDVDLGDNTLIKGNMTTSVVVQTTTCYPASGEITIFGDKAYAGDCVKLPVGDYPNSRTMKFPIYSISSILVSDTVRVSICAKENFVDCEALAGNAPNLGLLPIGDNRIFSIRVNALK